MYIVIRCTLPEFCIYIHMYVKSFYIKPILLKTKVSIKIHPVSAAKSKQSALPPSRPFRFFLEPLCEAEFLSLSFSFSLLFHLINMVMSQTQTPTSFWYKILLEIDTAKNTPNTKKRRTKLFSVTRRAPKTIFRKFLKFRKSWPAFFQTSHFAKKRHHVSYKGDGWACRWSTEPELFFIVKHCWSKATKHTDQTVLCVHQKI